MAGLVVTGSVTLYALIAFVAVLGTMSLLYDAAHQSYLPRLVPPAVLPKANARPAPEVRRRHLRTELREGLSWVNKHRVRSALIALAAALSPLRTARHPEPAVHSRQSPDQ